MFHRNWDPPGPEFPGVMGQAPAEAKANPILSDDAAPAPHFPLDTTGLANDGGVGGLLEKVAVLKQRMSARRSLRSLG